MEDTTPQDLNSVSQVTIQFTDKLVGDINPFSVEDELNAFIDGQVELRPGRRGGNTLNAVVKTDQVSLLCTLTSLCGCPVNITPLEPPKLGPRGFIRCHLLNNLSPEAIQDRLKSQGVVAVRKLLSALDPKRDPGYVLTFDCEIPEKLKVCGMCLPVAIYSSPPMRCYGCQTYGHVQAYCKRRRVCPRCALTHDGDHDEKGCSLPQRCAACRGPHDSRSTFCPQYKKEARAKKYAQSQQISVPDAKVLLSQSLQRSQNLSQQDMGRKVQGNFTYAQAAASNQQTNEASPVEGTLGGGCTACPALEVRLSALEKMMQNMGNLFKTVADLSNSMASLTTTLSSLVAKVDLLAQTSGEVDGAQPTQKKRRQLPQRSNSASRQTTVAPSEDTQKVLGDILSNEPF